MPSKSPQFRTTRWTMVAQASHHDAESLERLCQAYWYPLYAFVRRSGHGSHDAQDLTQAFFSQLLEKDWLKAVQPDQGKFRTFLMMAMKRFLANEWKSSQRQKRGGGQPVLSMDLEAFEERYALEPIETAGPTDVFDRRWAMQLLAHTLNRLEAEQDSSATFDALKPALTAGHGSFDCATAAAKLDLSEGAVRVAVHRLRKRYRELFRDEIAATVSDPSEVDAEIRYLVDVLARG